MKEIKAKEGFYLTDKNKESFYTFLKGISIQEENYTEISIEEANKIIQEREAINKLSSIEEVDNVIATNNAIPKVINTFDLDDSEALKRKNYYPQWDDFIGKSLEVGFKVIYEGKLYKVRQKVETVLENQYPSINTAALYEEINESAAGTLEDPIPYNNNMELEEGKYYSQGGITYLCTRSTGQPVYHNLSDLVNLYVKKVE